MQTIKGWMFAEQVLYGTAYNIKIQRKQTTNTSYLIKASVQ